MGSPEESTAETGTAPRTRSNGAVDARDDAEIVTESRGGEVGGDEGVVTVGIVVDDP